MRFSLLLILSPLLVLAQPTVPATGPATEPSGDSPPLTTTAALRAMAPEQAGQRLPVKVRGVVTYLATQPPIMFVQDSTGGICVSGQRDRETRPQVKLGSLVEVEGVTAAGGATYLVARPKELVHVTFLADQGPASLPVPRSVSLAQLGDSGGALVEATAVVRAVRSEAQPTGAAESLVITLASAGERIEAVILPWPQVRAIPKTLVGATVRVRGVFNAASPERQQMAANRLLVAVYNKDLRVLEPASQPSALPVVSIASLRHRVPEASLPTRARIRATVTLVVAGKGMYVQDTGSGIWIEVPPGDVKPNDGLELLGFPVRRGSRVVLEDAEWHPQAELPPAAAPLVTAEHALAGDLDSQIVAMEALVLGVSRLAEGPTLVLQSGERVFLARLAAPGVSLPAREDTWVRVTGVCVNNRLPDAPEAGRPVSFHLLLASPGAVQLIAAPGWWTLRHVLAIGGGLLAIALAAFIWAVALRRRVAHQTRLIRGHLARETLNEERMRIARELHDSLEQDLLGITMQLTATEKLLGQPGKAREALVLASAMVRRSQAETHRAVWDLRAANSNGDGLVGNLRDAVAGLSPASGPHVEVRVSGDRPLPPHVENHVQRVALEAVTNAIKHACAASIEVTLDFGVDRVVLRVTDDGRGFDASALPAPSSGHFGLFGMRERAEKVKGELCIQSEPGRGTEIRLTIPVG